MDKIFFMNEAINEAKKAYDKGETPIGAVIVNDSAIRSRFWRLRLPSLIPIPIYWV